MNDWRGNEWNGFAGLSNEPSRTILTQHRVGVKNKQWWISATTQGRPSSDENDGGPVLVAFVVYPESCALDVTGPSDVFATASQLAGSDLYRSVLVGTAPEQVIATESGVRLVVDKSLDEIAGDAHTLLVSGGNGFRAALQDKALIDSLASVGADVDRLGSICNGTFLLAEAGLVSGCRVTTHWAFADELKTTYPKVEVVPDEIYVSSGRVLTSAGVTAGIDLALAVVAADHGPELARTVARRMVVYLNRSGGQSQFSERLRPDAGDVGIAATISRVKAEPGADHSVAAMAREAGMSDRTFARKFRAHTGTTPARWVERVRVDIAREALESTTGSTTQVAHAAGFASDHTMRQAFQRVLGVSPARYRNTHSALKAKR